MRPGVYTSPPIATQLGPFFSRHPSYGTPHPCEVHPGCRNPRLGGSTGGGRGCPHRLPRFNSRRTPGCRGRHKGPGVSYSLPYRPVLPKTLSGPHGVGYDGEILCSIGTTPPSSPDLLPRPSFVVVTPLSLGPGRHDLHGGGRGKRKRTSEKVSTLPLFVLDSRRYPT